MADQPPVLMAHRTASGSNGAPARARAKARRRQAMELRRVGVRYETIADQLGYGSPQAARQAVRMAIAQCGEEEATMLRALLHERQMTYLSHFLPLAMAPVPEMGPLKEQEFKWRKKLDALNACMRADEAVIKIYGLDKTVPSVVVQADSVQSNTLVIGGETRAQWTESVREAKRALGLPDDDVIDVAVED